MQAKPSPSTPVRRSARRSADQEKKRGGAGHGGRKAPRQPAYGHVLNELVLLFIRHKDAISAQREAAQAARCGMTRQRLHQIHTDLKVITLPLLYQWCSGKHYRGSDVLRVMEDYLESGGSIEHARKCQGCLP